MYAKSHARVVPAEVWARTLADIQSTDGSSPNLLALVSGDLADSYAAITAKETDIADAKAQIATEKEAKDAKDATEEDKKGHDKTIDDLKKKVSKLEDEVDPLRTKFLAAAKDAAQKAPPAARDAVGPVLVNLRQAVDDASIADGAAAVRYPLALKSLFDSVTEVVVADIVEEQTGHRPIMSGFKPDVKLDGTDVKLTLNGLGPDDLGKLSLGELTTETLDRTKKWVVHAITLIGAVSSTKDTLSFEQDTLDALLDGFAANGWKKAEAAKIPGGDDPKVAGATAKVHTHGKASSAKSGVAEAQGAKVAIKATTTAKGTGPAPKGTTKTPTKKPGKSTTTPATAPTTTPASTKASTTASLKAVVTATTPAPMRPEDFNP